MLTLAHQYLQESSAVAKYSIFAKKIQEDTKALESITHLNNATTEDRNIISKLTDLNAKLQSENSTL